MGCYGISGCMGVWRFGAWECVGVGRKDVDTALSLFFFLQGLGHVCKSMYFDTIKLPLTQILVLYSHLGNVDSLL
jgi:hypothetical protein